MKQAIQTWFKQLLIRLSLRQATLPDAFDRLIKGRKLKE